MNTCARCDADLTKVAYATSYFNTDVCCTDCLRDERTLPSYAEAKRIETQAVQQGDYNFPGVGLSDIDRNLLALLASKRQRERQRNV